MSVTLAPLPLPASAATATDPSAPTAATVAWTESPRGLDRLLGRAGTENTLDVPIGREGALVHTEGPASQVADALPWSVEQTNSMHALKQAITATVDAPQGPADAAQAAITLRLADGSQRDLRGGQDVVDAARAVAASISPEPVRNPGLVQRLGEVIGNYIGGGV